MNKTLFALIFILCNAIASAADAVDVRVSSSADEVRAGETFYVNFKSLNEILCKTVPWLNCYCLCKQRLNSEEQEYNHS